MIVRNFTSGRPDGTRRPFFSVEPVRRPIAGVRDVIAALSGVQVANAFVAFIFAVSAPVAIILAAGARGGLTQSEIASWIFAAFTLNGILSIAMSLAYRMPLVHLWTIPGAVIVAPALGHLAFAEVIGAYFATGLLLLVLGLTGAVRRIMACLPLPIVMGMVAGIFLRFGLDWINAIRDDVGIALPMTIAYFALCALPTVSRRLPPMVGVLAVGIAAVALSGRMSPIWSSMGPSGGLLAGLAWPALRAPTFSLQAILELTIPLAVTVVVAQNAQGAAVLRACGHQPPINAITTACGIGSLITAGFGCVATCLTGPTNALLSSSGDRAGQYAAALLFSLLAIVFGMISPLIIALLLATPPAFIAALAGLALLRILQSAFKVSFGDRFTLGALVAFLITVADHTIYNIGAPFWSIIAGLASSWLLERKDFSLSKSGVGPACPTN